MFSLTFYGVSGHIWVEHLLTSLPGGQVGFLVFVNFFVFFLAFFLDFFELAFIVIPLLAPAAEQLGIDLIWFGVILGVNMQTSFMHPPFGFALFYLRSVAPRETYIDRVTGKRMEPVTTGQIYWGAMPFVVDPGDHGAAGDLLPGDGDALQRRGHQVDPYKVKIEIPHDRTRRRRSTSANRRISSSEFAPPKRSHNPPKASGPAWRPAPSTLLRFSLALDTAADHEAVEGIFGDLPPEVLRSRNASILASTFL